MGNGRLWLSGKALERSRGSRLRWVSVATAALVLVLAAGVILGSGSRPSAQNASTSGLPIPSAFGKAPSNAKPDAHSILSQLPMIFEANQGQVNPSVKFVAHGAGYSLYLDSTGALLAMRSAKPSVSKGNANGIGLETVRMSLAGANPKAAVVGSEELPGKSNYFIGNDPKKWRTGIPQFAGVRYQNIYPGIDLVFYGSQGRLEYDFKVAAGADPLQAEMQFDGASKLDLDGGDLILRGTGADVRLQAPHIYQTVAGAQQAVEGRFVLRAANRVGFEIGNYDRSRELVIDPTIAYSTYFGGSGSETSPSIAVNNDGFIYLAGSTTSTDLPVGPSPLVPIQSTLNAAAGAQNIFLLKLNPLASTAGVVYLTYLGGSGIDASAGLAVDSTGVAYIAGTTTSPNFPTTAAAFQTAPEAGSTGAPCFANETVPCHVFVTAINGLDSLAAPPAAQPALKYSTYLSGNGTDVATGLATDNKFNVYVTGTTTSTDQATGFPSSQFPAPYQKQSLGPIQFFVTAVDTQISGTGSVPYSTYFGGSNGTIAVGGGIAVDTVGNVYFSGTTNFFNSGIGQNGGGGLVSGDFPILNAYQPCLDTPVPVTVVPPLTCNSIASPAPTDAFVAKLNPANAQTGAAQLSFSTYLGGSGDDSSTGITVDAGAASIYVTGTTNSGDIVLPTAISVFQRCLDTPVNPAIGTACTAITAPAPTDAYVAKFSNLTEGTGIVNTFLGLSYFSYIGGTGNDTGLAIAVDTAAGAWVTGTTSSGPIGTTNFPITTGAIQSVLNGPQNAFFAHINTSTVSGQNAVGSYATYFGGNGTDRGTSVAIDTNLNSYFAGDTTSTNLQTHAPLQAALDGPSDAFAVKLQTASDLCIQCVAPVLSPASGAISAGNQVTVTFTVTNQGPDLATNITVTGQLSTTISAAFNSATAGGGTCSVPSGTSVVCTIPTLQAGSTSSVAMAVTPSKAGGGSVTAIVTNSNNTNTNNTATASFTATDFSVSITPSSQTVVAGNTAQYAVLVSPSQTYGANVSLSCASLPVGASCSFSPTTLNFNGAGSQSATMNLTTTARPVTTISSAGWHGPFYALWLMVPGIGLFGLGNKRRRSRMLGLFLMWTVLSLMVLLPACSSKKQIQPVTGTPAGSYPLSVTATSGTFTQTAGFSLTVQ
jgi:uncharacterized repeat protein (TIGR01451 family)